MRSRRRFLAPLFLLALLGAPVMACLWDRDTLVQERARFPAALELITGKFLRHSPEFYQWRIKDRLAKLKDDPDNLGYHDDLAVAYHKTGQHEKAVETILAKEKIKPGLYETYSNLGTFYILEGEFEKGLPYIDKALEINPNAHFGREKYQKALVEYALSRRKGGKLIFPLRPTPREERENEPSNFQWYLANKEGKRYLSPNDAQKAVKAVLGMMRFANHNNPLLLEALGDLLESEDYRIEEDAKRLAARAYLKASYEVKDEDARKGYRRLADLTLMMQTVHPETTERVKLESLEPEFEAELSDARKWYEEFKQREIGWIRDGKDVEAKFDQLYEEESRAFGHTTWLLDNQNLVAGGVVVAILVIVVVMRLRRSAPRTM
jgi:tetratricopeptide (TPR) repeat protein